MTGIKISASGNLFWAVFSAQSPAFFFFISFCDLLFRPKDKTNLSTIMLQVAFSSTASAWHHFAPAKLSICTPFFCKRWESGNIGVSDGFGEGGEAGGESSAGFVWRRVCTLDLSMFRFMGVSL